MLPKINSRTSSVELPFYAKLALLLAVGALVILLLELGKNLFIPLIFALLVAILLYPLNRFLEQKWHFSRLWATSFSLFLFMVGVTVFSYIVILQLVNFLNNIPDLKQRFLPILYDFQAWVQKRFHINQEEQMNLFKSSYASLSAAVTRSLGDLFFSVAGFILLAVFVFLYTFFILYYRGLLLKFFLNLFKYKNQTSAMEIVLDTKAMMGSYVAGLLIEMLMLAVINSICLYFIGTPYAILLGVMAALFNIVPYLGIYTSIFLTMLVTFGNSNMATTIESGAALMIIHLIEANILMPQIVGTRVKINSFITLLAVVLGELVWGIPGMFLFIPVVGLIKLISERVPGMEAWAILIGIEEKQQPQAFEEELPQKDTTPSTNDNFSVQPTA